MLEANGSRSFEFTLPAEIVRGSVSSSVTVYPTPLASMTEALQSLLREPNGCFEQTSSTSYPMVMAQQYFLTHTGVDPAIIEKARNLLEASYKKLTGFESPNERLRMVRRRSRPRSAHGLWPDAVHRHGSGARASTRTCSIARAPGCFRVAMATAVSTATPKPSIASAALPRTPPMRTSPGRWSNPERKDSKRKSPRSKHPPIPRKTATSLRWAPTFFSATGDQAGARQLMDKLAKNQDAAGNVKGAVTSITRSGGDALAIETTALSVLAWMREPAYAANVEKGLKWIVESNKNGRFGFHAIHHSRAALHRCLRRRSRAARRLRAESFSPSTARPSALPSPSRPTRRAPSSCPNLQVNSAPASTRSRSRWKMARACLSP